MPATSTDQRRAEFRQPPCIKQQPAHRVQRERQQRRGEPDQRGGCRQHLHLSANQFGRVFNGQNSAPAAQVTQMLIVSQGAQSIAFGAAPAVNEGGTGLVLFTSNQAITTGRFSSNTTTICAVSGVNNSSATGVAAGICSCTAPAPLLHRSRTAPAPLPSRRTRTTSLPPPL